MRDVLTNRKYTGAFVRFKTGTGQVSCDPGWRNRRPGGTDSPEKPEPMIREDNHEAIVDKRTFERVQAKLAKNQRHVRPPERLSVCVHAACYAAATAAAR